VKRAKKRSKKSFNILKGIQHGIGWTLIGIGNFVWLSLKYIGLGATSVYSQIRALFPGKAPVKKPEPVAPEQIGKPAQPRAPKEIAEKPAVFTPLEPVVTLKGDFERFANRMRTSSTIIMVAGKRGSGKSALGFRILENLNAKAQRPAYVLGVHQSILPDWIRAVEDLDEVHNGGVVLVDEGAISFSSRESMNKKNKELGKLLAIARHKDLTLILVTQNTGMIDKNVLNLCDTILLKEGSLLQKKMERGVMRDIYDSADSQMAKILPEERQKHVYIFDSDFEGVCKIALPSFWSVKISKNQA